MDVAHMTIIIDGCGWRGTSEMYVLSWSTRNLCKKCFLSEYDNIAQTGKHTYRNVMKPHGIYISWLPSSLLLQHHFFFFFFHTSNLKEISNLNGSEVACIFFCSVSAVITEGNRRTSWTHSLKYCTCYPWESTYYGLPNCWPNRLLLINLLQPW